MKIKQILRFGAAAMLLFAVCACAHKDPTANKLVILHTNDTHSQIDPDDKGRGGVMRRMAVIDSIRNNYANVMLVDAGDDVQGTLYFYLYGGAVEQEILNIMGLDEGIMGNHEFDNGMDSLASILRLRDRKLISSNYVVEGTPLDTLVMPYSVRDVRGKKIGFMGINVDPQGIISDENWRGLGFMPIVETANATAAHLRDVEGVDAVIALTHIGYAESPLFGDSILATNSRGIDVIIGGHSHDIIDPETEQGAARSHLKNLDGKTVLVTQTGKAGLRLGKIEIDLDSLGTATPQYELITIDSRFDGYTNPALQAVIDRYRPGVDSLMTLWVGEVDHDMAYRGDELQNYFADFVLKRGKDLAQNVDLAIVNKGGLRTPLAEGQVSKGQIINLVPFRNSVTVVDIMGDELLNVFKVLASTQGNCISANVRGTYIPDGDNGELASVTINGRPINPAKKYRVATIDYLANGGDYMDGFRTGTVVASSPNMLYDDMLDYIVANAAEGRKIQGDATPRWTPVQ